MHRTTAYGATDDGKYKEGNRVTGDPATRVTAKSMNAIQEELCHIVEGAGIALDEDDDQQCYKAIVKTVRAANRAVNLTEAAFAEGVETGDAVYYDPVEEHFDKAIADGTDVNEVVGIADVDGERVIAFGETGAIMENLTPGTRYYLSATTPGALTTDPEGDGILVGRAKSASELFVNIQQEEHHGVAIESAPFDESVNDRDVVRWDAAESEFVPAVADGTANRNAVGIADLIRGRVLMSGVLDGFSNLTPGTRYYLSADSAGELTETPPDDAVAVGVAKSATEMFVNLEVGRAPPAWSTGDVKLTMKTVADPGWVMADDGTIGNTGSGATTRANADTEALFTLLWNNVTDDWAPVSDGRGASAAEDFAAGKTIALTKMLGRALAVAGEGDGLTERVLGEVLGEEEHTLTISEMPQHSHTIPGNNTDGDGTSVERGPGDDGDVSTDPEGSGDPHNNMQPTTFLNVMIKL